VNNPPHWLVLVVVLVLDFTLVFEEEDEDENEEDGTQSTTATTLLGLRILRAGFPKVARSFRLRGAP
jgi:hypothetical protein